MMMHEDNRWREVMVIIFLSLLALALTSCSPRVRLVPVERTHIEWRDRLRLDSIYVHDSIYLTERMAGDTIYKVKEVYRWRDRWRIDTINTGRIDSVHVTEVVEVPAHCVAILAVKSFCPSARYCARPRCVGIPQAVDTAAERALTRRAVQRAKSEGLRLPRSSFVGICHIRPTA